GIVVLVADLEMAATVSRETSPAVRRLAERFWPGALTLVLPARDGLPAPLTAGTGTIGVRVPAHPAARALVAGAGGPVTAPSANPPGAQPPRTVEAARAYFGAAGAGDGGGGAVPRGASAGAGGGSREVRVRRAGPVPESALRAALDEKGWRS